MKAKYIDKTFPITLQDLIDLAKSENKDPRDLKLIMNEHDPNYTGYAQCAVLNQDCDKVSIELYQANGYPQSKDEQKRSVPRSHNKPQVLGHPKIDQAYEILGNINRITDDVNIVVVSEEDLKSLTEAYLWLQSFHQKQQ